jgi:hypothetical protein
MICSVCCIEKEEYHFRKKTSMCRPCQDEYLKQYYLEHKEEKKIYKQKHYQANKKKINEKQKQYYEANKDTILTLNGNWRKEHPDKMKEYLNKYHIKNENKLKAYKREYQKLWDKNPIHRVSSRFGAQLYSALRLRKRGRRWEQVVGYSLNDLMSHLESMFVQGMSWENYGEWHIDHIIPKKSFNYENENDKDFINCWSLDNLQPLWAEDNLRKSARLDYAQKLKAFYG